MANNGIYYSSGNSLNFTTNNTTWSTLTSGGTFQMSAVSATTYYNLPFSGTVFGEGTTNFVPVWTGSTGLGNSLIQSNANGITIGGALDSGHLAFFYTTGATGIQSSAGNFGVVGLGGTVGVQGFVQTGGYGVYGETNSGIGVYGNSYGDTGPNIGVRGESNYDGGGTPENIGGYFSAINGGTNYSVQLTDGTEGTNKVLVSQTSDGKSNWSDSLTGLTSISATTYYNYPGSSSANCVTTFFVTNISGCSPVNMLSPLNLQDGLSVTGTSTFTSQANFIGGLSANTFSANTYQNLPSFNSVQINGTTQFLGDTNNFINFSGINITITSAATNTLVFSAGTGGGGGISGGGTTNYIPKFTGLTGIGNSQLQDDGSQVFTNQGYGSTLTGNLSINASGTTGIAGRATQYGVYGTISGATAGASAVYGEAGTGQYGVYGLNQGDTAGEYIGVYGRGQQSDSGVAGTVYIGGKFYGDNGTGEGYSVQLQDGTEGVGKVLVSQTSDGKANWNTFSGINITITSAATNTLVFSAGTGGGGGAVSSVTAGSGLSGNTTTGAITLITNISASSISDSTTVGQNLITIPNPSEIRYLRINADNSITTLTLAQLKTDLGSKQISYKTNDQGSNVLAFANLTDLSFSVVDGKTYRFKILCRYDTTNTSTGSRWAVNGPTFTRLFYSVLWTSGAGLQSNTAFDTYDATTSTVNSNFTTNNCAIIEGVIIPSASGTLSARFACELTITTVTCKAGSFIEYEEI